MIWVAAVLPGGGGCVESNPDMHAADSNHSMSMSDSSRIPNIPETTQRLFEDADVVAYVLIDRVEDRIEKPLHGGHQPEVTKTYPRQRCTASLLWILKGNAALQNEKVHIVKEPSRYFVSEKEKRVLYLQKRGNFFQTIDSFGGEPRLASALCDMRNSRKDAHGGGVVASFQGSDKISSPIIHVLRGRQPTSLRMADATWKTFLLRSKPIGEFDICEIPLEQGTYTVVMEMGGRLVSYTRLLDGYYACVKVGEYRWWEPLYFVP